MFDLMNTVRNDPKFSTFRTHTQTDRPWMIRLLLRMEQSVRSEATVFAILGCFTGVDIRFWKALALEGGGVRGVRLA